MRALSASGASLGAEAADVLGTLDPTIAAVVSLSPDDACLVASKLSLRYAIQCWDDSDAGKAIFWKTSIPMQGLYRAEFRDRDTGDDCRRGLLRVTLLWDGRPLHVFCVSLSASPEEAAWQLVQTAREVDSVRGPIVLAIAAAGAQLPNWPHLADAWSRAPWRSLAYPPGIDLGLATHTAFGLGQSQQATATDRPDRLREDRVHLLCSDTLSVMRARLHVTGSGSTGGDVLVVDLAAADGDDASLEQASRDLPQFGGREPGSRTGAFSA